MTKGPQNMEPQENRFASAEEQVEMPAEQYGGLEIAGWLSVDGGEVTLEDSTVTLPSYSVVVLVENPQ